MHTTGNTIFSVLKIYSKLNQRGRFVSGDIKVQGIQPSVSSKNSVPCHGTDPKSPHSK